MKIGKILKSISFGAIILIAMIILYLFTLYSEYGWILSSLVLLSVIWWN